MAQSPYIKAVQPPIADLEEYVEELRQYRSEVDRGENNKFAQVELTEIGETLLEHCHFLIEKLKIKTRDLQSLRSENGRLKEEIEKVKQSRSKGENTADTISLDTTG